MKKEIAHSWFKAFNEHNLENLLSLYDDNDKHYSPKLKLKYPETKGLIIGKQNLSNWWAESFKNIPSLQYVPNFILEDDGKIFMEYLRKAEQQDDIVVGELLCIENNLIIESKVYHS